MSRPTSDNSKHHQYRLRLDDSDVERLEFLAKHHNKPKSEVLRDLIGKEFSSVVWMEMGIRTGGNE